MRPAPRLALHLPVLALLVGILFSATALTAQPSDRLTLADYLEWESVGGPALSPDGSQIIYTRRWTDKLNDRRESSLHIMNADGSRPRKLLDGGSAQWSPDGTRIAFTASGEPEGSQIFVRWMDAEGATTQITHLTSGPSSITWSPDGEWIAFMMNVPGESNRWSAEGRAMSYRPSGGEWTEAPRVVEELDYRADGRGFTSNDVRQIFVVPANGGSPRQITYGEWSAGSPNWTPDGRSIVFAAGPRVEESEYVWRESEIYSVDVATNEITQLTDRRGSDGSPAISPDGRLIAYTGNDFGDYTYDESELYIMNIDGSGSRILADIDRSPSGLEWAPDGSGVYFSVQDRGTRNLHFAPLDGEPRQVTEGQHILSVGDIGDDGTVVATLTSPHEPGDVVTFHVDRPGDIQTLTDVNGDVLFGKKLGEVEEIWYTSVDDYEIQGWIVKPPDFDPTRQYPLMLSIHGGPHGMYNVGFNFGYQEHAANDFVVLYTNPRGSSGYGSEFGNAIKNAYPSKDYDDLMNGVDEVIARGYIDTDNLFVYGCSGGGVLTAWTVGHTDRFAAASANCPVINWLSFVGTTDGPNWYRNFENYPWEDPTEHLQRSPLMYVGNVTTPTMLMTGEMDLRTPIAQTEEFYQALKMLKVPTAMIRFKDQWHGTTSRPSNFIRTQLYLREWFTRHGRAPLKPVTEEGVTQDGG